MWAMRRSLGHLGLEGKYGFIKHNYWSPTCRTLMEIIYWLEIHHKNRFWGWHKLAIYVTEVDHTPSNSIPASLLSLSSSHSSLYWQNSNSGSFNLKSIADRRWEVSGRGSESYIIVQSVNISLMLGSDQFTRMIRYSRPYKILFVTMRGRIRPRKISIRLPTVCTSEAIEVKPLFPTALSEFGCIWRM